ncbi:hypothetical protein ILUMI_23204 [Ignelater luminosus]|uniref:Uncharacterized protein n=1 Tax=Ignelater luminosus TaxID=2038154 RepID=A0A8K0G1V3_IGNLU|nr:hypothetical protein ILUMI_23204 [Ignelater luminosus]
MDRKSNKSQSQETEDSTMEVEQTKPSFNKRSTITEQLDILVGNLTYKVLEAQKNYKMNKKSLLDERKELFHKSDLSNSQLAFALAELDQKIADNDNMHDEEILVLKGQRMELLKDLALKTQNLDATICALQLQNDEMLSDLKEQKLHAAPAELEEINRRIEELKRIFFNDMKTLKELQAVMPKGSNFEDYSVPEILESRGLRLTPSGYFLTETGRLLTYSEASCMGLLEGIDHISWESVLRTYQDIKKSSSDMSLTTPTTMSASKISCKDAEYLSTTLVKPLTLALTEITTIQPRDPIHYLSHRLFKYRYNQEINITRQQEALQLINERKQLEQEKWSAMIEEKTRKIVLDMIIKAEEEAIRNELERIARETATINVGEDGE